MIGVEFLHDAMKELSSMTKSTKLKKKETPYMYQMYNITGYFTVLGTRGPLKIINPVIDALNDMDKLPKFMQIIPDKDLLSPQCNSNFMMGVTLHYIIKQIDLFIERRHQDLLHKRIGALAKDYPKTIWVRMIKWPNPDELKKIDVAYSLRGKFNAVLGEWLLDGHADMHHIMSIVVQDEYFTSTGS